MRLDATHRGTKVQQDGRRCMSSAALQALVPEDVDVLARATALIERRVATHLTDMTNTNTVMAVVVGGPSCEAGLHVCHDVTRRALVDRLRVGNDESWRAD